MATPNGRLGTPVATPFRFLHRINFCLNFETMSQSHYMLSPQIFGPSRYYPIIDILALLLVVPPLLVLLANTEMKNQLA